MYYIMVSKLFLFHLLLYLNIFHLGPFWYNIFELLARSWPKFKHYPQLVLILRVLIYPLLIVFKRYFELLADLFWIQGEKFILCDHQIALYGLLQKYVHHVVDEGVCLFQRSGLEAFNKGDALYDQLIFIQWLLVLHPFLNLFLRELRHRNVPVVEIEVPLFRWHL